MAKEIAGQINDFTTGNIPVKLAKFMIPILGALILQAMYGAVDLLVVGWFMSKFERFCQDQFPLRDAFRRVKAGFSYYILRKLDNNGIYLADGYAVKNR